MQFSAISFDQIILAVMTCIALRELMILTLPDTVAGPGGWLIDTGSDKA